MDRSEIGISDTNGNPVCEGDLVDIVFHRGKKGVNPNDDSYKGIVVYLPLYAAYCIQTDGMFMTLISELTRIDMIKENRVGKWRHVWTILEPAAANGEG